MGYCKHEWQDRSDVLRVVFCLGAERKGHAFYVCTRCLKIDEVRQGPRLAGAPLGGRAAVAA